MSRKTKTERELLADIHKSASLFCLKNDCEHCPMILEGIVEKPLECCDLKFVEYIIKKDDKNGKNE